MTFLGIYFAPEHSRQADRDYIAALQPPVIRVGNMGEMCYNYSSTNHIKSSGALERTRYPFSKFCIGEPTMPDHTPQPSALKVCSKCGESKPLSEFTKRSANKDGLRETCKPCSRAISREYHYANRESRLAQITEYRLANKEKLAETERARRADPAYREKCSVDLKEWRENNRDHVAAYNRSLPVRARSAVNTAVRKGQLPPPDTMVCDSCDEALADHYHHVHGYEPEHWLNVIALCTECHGREHRVMQ